MGQPPRLVIVALLSCVGCAPSAEDVRAAFEETVAASNACERDTDCAIASSDCPLGCWVVVRADRVEEVEQRARELIADYERSGTRCEYDCIAPGEPVCTEGRCAADP